MTAPMRPAIVKTAATAPLFSKKDLEGAAATAVTGVSVGVGGTEVIVTMPPLLVAMTGFIVVEGRPGVTMATAEVVIVGVEVVGTTTVTIGVDAGIVETAAAVVTAGASAEVVTGRGAAGVEAAVEAGAGTTAEVEAGAGTSADVVA